MLKRLTFMHDRELREARKRSEDVLHLNFRLYRTRNRDAIDPPRASPRPDYMQSVLQWTLATGRFDRPTLPLSSTAPISK